MSLIDRVEPEDIARAKRFFWSELIVASLFSLAANLAHAVKGMDLNTGWAWIAMGAAMGIAPPIFLAQTTHSLTQLRRISHGSWDFVIALTTTLLVDIVAFALSFFATRQLATDLGAVRADLAWLWPLLVDIAVVHATYNLLVVARLEAQLRREHAESLQRAAVDGADQPSSAQPVELAPAVDAVGAHAELLDAAETSAVQSSTLAPSGYDFSEFAESLVEEGASKQKPEVIAQILSMHHADMAPHAIAVELGINRSVVTNVINKSRKLLKEAVAI